MIRSKIQIEKGAIQDFYDAYGFIYVDADERLAAPEKEDAVTDYIGQSGENRDGRVVKAPFDYTAAFIIEAPNKDLHNVNVKINNFNRATRETIQCSCVMRKKEITFYNLLNRVKIVGTCEPIAEAKECYRSNIHGELDWVKVELKIRVSNPDKCDFELKTENL